MVILAEAVEMRRESFAPDRWVDWSYCGQKGWWIDVAMVRQRVGYSDKGNSKILLVGASQIVGTG